MWTKAGKMDMPTGKTEFILSDFNRNGISPETISFCEKMVTFLSCLDPDIHWAVVLTNVALSIATFTHQINYSTAWIENLVAEKELTEDEKLFVVLIMIEKEFS